ncbi:MAG: DUF4340 domain-containing protein [Desulfohalobiaceae bacterium]|nr:DUF4340 domain-containing protein [Desulfohalobiaceae bacterium]
MKRAKEYTILLAVIIGIGLYLALRSPDGVHYDLPQLESISTQEVDEVLVRSGNSSLSLRRTNGTWSIADKGYEAQGDKVQKMLRQVADPGISALVSETGDYSRYDLDRGSRIQVKLLQDGKAVRVLHVGKSAGQVQSTYVRLPGDQNIYMAESDLRGTFDTTAKELRDKTVFSFDAEKVRAVRLASENASRRIHRAETGDNATHGTERSVWRTKQGEMVQADKMDNLLRSLKDLRCREYRQDLSRNGTRYTIRVKTDTRQWLRLYAPEKKRPKAYEAESSQSPDPFELPGYLGKEVVSTAKGLLAGPTQQSGSQ